MAASGLVLSMPGVAFAGTHYAFVKFEVVASPDAARIGGEELPRGEWIQCKRISYGLKRDIGTGARVRGHTHYDRIEFDCPQGPSTPMLMQALERGHTVNCTIKFYSNREREGRPLVKISGPGVFETLQHEERLLHAVFYFIEPINEELAMKARELSES